MIRGAAPSTRRSCCARQESDDAACLTAPQVDAAKKMYEGTKNPRTGELIYTGWPKGSEGFGETASQGWRQYVLDPVEPMRVGFFRYWLFHNENWDFRTIDWERDLAYAEEKLPHMAAVDKDLTPFKKSGGKLLMYTGWLDPVVPPQDTVAYYEGVTKTMGGLRGDARFLPVLHRARHGALRRRSWTEPVRRDRRARTVGGKRRGARQADRHAQHERQSRSLAAAVPVPDGGALQRHGQQR